jgi:hypothetical protein
MGLTIDFEEYYIPIELDMTTKERDDVKHFFYGCENCGNSVVSTKFCPKCNKEVSTKKIYPNGENEEVGSKDIWDFKRVPIDDLEIQRITTWKYVRLSEKALTKKPKASEIAKYKEQVAKFGNSKTLKDLFLDIGLKRQALECKIVFTGKINDGWLIPYPFFRKHKCLILAVADGNMVSVNPKEEYKPIESEITIKTGKAETILSDDKKDDTGKEAVAVKGD